MATPARTTTDMVRPIEIDRALDTELIETDMPVKTVALKPNEVLLSDGRVIGVRKTTGMDDTTIDAIVFDAFSNGLGVVPPSIALRASALNAVYTIDGEVQAPITDITQLRARLFDFQTDDIDVIGDKYLDIIGKKKKMTEAIREAQEAVKRGITF